MSGGKKRTLEGLIRRWKKDERKFTTAQSAETVDVYTRNRYEGIARGIRWCAEDLKKFIKDGTHL